MTTTNRHTPHRTSSTPTYYPAPTPKRTPITRTNLLPVAGWLIVLLSALYAAIKIAPIAHGDDWASLYIGGMLAGQGDWHEAYAVDANDFSLTGSDTWRRLSKEHTTVNVAHPFVHNPGVALFMAGFSSLFTFTQSMFILTFISGACAPLIPAAAYKFWTSETIPWSYLVPATVMVWLTEPFNMSLHLGQTTPLILTSCMLALALAKDNPVAASIMLSLATFVKLTPIVVIIGLLIVPATRRAGTYTLVMASTWFTSLFLIVHEPVGVWISSLKEHGSAFLVSPINAALSSVIYAPLRDNEGVAIITDVPSSPVTLAMALVIAMVGFVFLRSWKRSYVFPEESFLTLCLLGPMCVASILWIHYSVMLVFPIVGFVVWGLRRKDWALVSVGVVGSGVLVVPFDFGHSATWNPVTLMHISLWIIVTVAVAAMGCRDRNAYSA